MINVIIRKYQENDCEELAKLFYIIGNSDFCWNNE